MKVSIRNLGVLSQAQFEVKDLTVICGANNTGKTYATYALYGFLTHHSSNFVIELVDKELYRSLIQNGEVNTREQTFIEAIKNCIYVTCNYYKAHLPTIFGTHADAFENAHFEVDFDEIEAIKADGSVRLHGYNNTPCFEVTKQSGQPFVAVKLVQQYTEMQGTEDNLRQWLNRGISHLLIENILPWPAIASIERTGAATFQRELDISKNRFVEQLSMFGKDFRHGDLDNVLNDKRYPLPVRNNIDFVRDLENIAKNEGSIAKAHPSILEAFNVIAGGTYGVSKHGIYFAPKKSSKKQLSMIESASSVRSLLHLGMYLKHIAAPGDLLMIDEPELNLHPANQRMMARLLAKLVNLGVKVYITTHSDYIIREFNTLIMMRNLGDKAEPYMQKHGYKKIETLDPKRIGAYIARESLVEVEGSKRRKKRNTIVPAQMDSEGIGIDEFDTTIDIMNKIQEDLFFSGGLK